MLFFFFYWFLYRSEFVYSWVNSEITVAWSKPAESMYKNVVIRSALNMHSIIVWLFFFFGATSTNFQHDNVIDARFRRLSLWWEGLFMCAYSCESVAFVSFLQIIIYCFIFWMHRLVYNMFYHFNFIAPFLHMKFYIPFHWDLVKKKKKKNEVSSTQITIWIYCILFLIRSVCFVKDYCVAVMCLFSSAPSSRV